MFGWRAHWFWLCDLSGGCGSACAAFGGLKKVDREKMTITLDDGKSYKLPGETDMDGIKEGMDIVLAYDKVDGENLVTDMQTSE